MANTAVRAETDSPTDVTVPGAVPADVAPPGLLRETWDALRANRGAMAGLVVLTLLVLAAVFAGLLSPYAPYEQYRDHVLQPPAWQAGGSREFPLGTDDVGRDMLTRLLHGARFSLFIALTVMVVSVLLGVALGLWAAFKGGIVDTAIMRVMDLIMSVPDLVLAIVIVAVLLRRLQDAEQDTLLAALMDPSLQVTILAVTIAFLPRYVRLVRASALAELSKDYVVAARVAGVGPLRLAFVTVLPNCVAPLIVQSTLGISDAILETAALGFLGLGAQPPIPEWGAMLASAREFLQQAPWVVTLPGIAILITVISINLLGDGLRDALDPKLKRG